MRLKRETPATRNAFRAIIDREFAGSQLAFSRQCGLDTADTSRVLHGVRPASVEMVDRATAALDETAASELIAAFLADILAGLSKPYSVVVRPASGWTADGEPPRANDRCGERQLG